MTLEALQRGNEIQQKIKANRARMDEIIRAKSATSRAVVAFPNENALSIEVPIETAHSILDLEHQLLIEATQALETEFRAL